ncbi:hypothetical protein DAERI_100107 [Deinococcus aerius]|uniref:Uncharacterized protein n=1 Tax=Deinococcus aerius TaxID=200253 RepID=A0A2I9CXD9_9DEIO|nr:hypothetical protein [Deinococcus aerius]GBF06744.1 hypothetical protein DAERI_100107 [Deinococcus aerius]
MVPVRAALTVLAVLPTALAAPPAFQNTAFCQRYGCVAVGSLTVTPGTRLELYTFRGPSRAELRVWRDGSGVPGATYVLHRPEGGGGAKFPVIAQFLSAAAGVPVTERDVRRASRASPDEVRRAREENVSPFVVHLLRGGAVYTVQVVEDSGAGPDWSLTVRLYRDERIPRLLTLVPDVWGLKPVLSFLRGGERAAYGLDRWLDLTPSQRAAFDRLVARDAAFVRANAAAGASSDPGALGARMTAFLRDQDAALRRLLGGQYPSFRAWVRTNWAAQ